MMNRFYSDDLPENYMWVEDLARKDGVSEKTLVEKCENEMLKAILVRKRWAVYVVPTNNTHGISIVRDLTAQRDIFVTSIGVQYIHVNPEEERIRENQEKMARQKPVREKIKLARSWLQGSWIVAGSGAIFFIVGLMFTWPLGTFIMLGAVYYADLAVKAANASKDSELIKDANSVRNYIYLSASCLWITFILASCSIGSFMAANP